MLINDTFFGHDAFGFGAKKDSKSEPSVLIWLFSGSEESMMCVQVRHCLLFSHGGAVDPTVSSLTVLRLTARGRQTAEGHVNT